MHEEKWRILLHTVLYLYIEKASRFPSPLENFQYSVILTLVIVLLHWPITLNLAVIGLIELFSFITNFRLSQRKRYSLYYVAYTWSLFKMMDACLQKLSFQFILQWSRVTEQAFTNTPYYDPHFLLALFSLKHGCSQYLSHLSCDLNHPCFITVSY